MTNILDYFLKKAAPFRPESMDELLALRLAQRLGDTAAIEHYVRLVAEYSAERCLSAYRRVSKGQTTSPATEFHAELQRSNGRCQPTSVRLIAIKVERRSIAAVISGSRYPEYADVRHLSSSLDRAQTSAIGFINWMLSNYEVQSAAMEIVSAGNDIRRAVLSKAILENCILNRDISLWPVAKQDLLQSFGHPPLRSRKELRTAILSIWPDLLDRRGSEQLLDAAALGAFVQTERLFLS